MNNLEWINKQIEECNKIIENLKMRIIEDKKYPSLVKAHMGEIENITQSKQRFEQIKTELIEYNEIKKYGISYENFKKKEVKDEKNE